MSEPSDIEKSCVDGPSKRADLAIAEEDVELLYNALVSTRNRIGNLRRDFGIDTAITVESPKTELPILNRVMKLSNKLALCIAENMEVNGIVGDIERVVGKEECAKD